MTARILIAWLALLVVAVLNGAFREAIVTPRFGPAVGHVASSVLLSALITVVTYFAAPWIGIANRSQALAVGLVWLALTLAFEFGFGRARGKSWSDLLADYNLARGRIWVLVLFTTALAPWVMARLRGLIQ